MTDGVWESNEAQVYITINEVFDPPTATDISIELLEDESVLIDLSGFDTDSDDNGSEFSIVSNLVMEN